MGRHQVNPIRKYFTFEPASNKSICQIVGCEARIAGNHGGNLQRHIEKKHPSTYLEVHRQHGLKRPAADGGQTASHSVEEGEEEEEEAHEYDSVASASNIFSQYRPLTPPENTEQAVSFRLKGENDEDLLMSDLPQPRALKHDMVLKQFTDIMLADMQQIQDPLLLMKLRRDVTDLVFKAVEEDAKRSQIGNRKELYCQIPRFQMSSEPCSSGAGPSSYLKNSRKQRRASKIQRMPVGGGGGGGGGTGEEWRAGMCELNGAVALQNHQVKTETEPLEEMELPVYFSPINLEGNNEG